MWRKVISRQKGIIIFVFGAIVLSAIFITNRESPIYLAKAKIELSLEEDLIGDYPLEDFGTKGFIFTTEVWQIKSPQIIEKVAKRLALVPEWASRTDFGRFIRQLSMNINVRRLRGGNIVEINVISDSPKRAVNLANTVAYVYIEDVERRKREEERSHAFLQAIEKELETKGKVNFEKYLRQLKNTRFAELESMVLKDRRQRWKNILCFAWVRGLERAPDVRIVEQASLPGSPIRPLKVRNVIIAVLIGLPVAISFAFLLEHLEVRAF